MKHTIPRILVAGAASGVGKTSVSLGLVKAYQQRGNRVQTFKTGPDYLDPTYLALASGVTCYNLDTWMMGVKYVRQLFQQHTGGCDLIIIEGAMGLFDGASACNSAGSSAEIASLLQVPVLLVVDAHGTARSLAALVKGYVEFEPKLRFLVVIANNCGSAGHVKLISQALRSCSLPPLVGAIPKGELPRLPSRHLGLVTAEATNLTQRILAELAQRIHDQIDLGRLLASANSANTFVSSQHPCRQTNFSRSHRLGLARDRAFHFYYPDNLEAFVQRGAELVCFSPLKDQRLPEGLDALYLGGGYPEAHAAELAANRQLHHDIQRFAKTGKPLYAECGGLMYLSQSLRTVYGQTYPMTNVLPFSTHMRKKRSVLGYVEVCLNHPSVFGKPGTTLRGHEFHYSALAADTTNLSDWKKAYTLRRRRGAQIEQEGFARGLQLASYVHTHLASQPEVLDQFVSACGGNHV